MSFPVTIIMMLSADSYAHCSGIDTQDVMLERRLRQLYRSRNPMYICNLTYHLICSPL